MIVLAVAVHPQRCTRYHRFDRSRPGVKSESECASSSSVTGGWYNPVTCSCSVEIFRSQSTRLGEFGRSEGDGMCSSSYH